MKYALPVAVALLYLMCCSTSASALDAFDRHTSYWVKQAAKKFEAVKELSSGQAAKLKGLSSRVISPCVVIKTDQRNWTKALVSWGFRKGTKGLTPVLLIERYVTYDGDRGDVAVAQGKNVMLFPGFEFDFDIGQVVPAGEGADVAFNKRLLSALGEATLHGVNGSVLPAAEPDKYDRHADPKVIPLDFAGTWKVNADGRWVGTWEIGIGDNGTVFGRYHSDETKSTFPIHGRVTASQLRHRLRFEVEFAAANQEYDMYLWTTDKSTMAGTTTLINRKFGVVAVREKPQPKGKEKPKKKEPVKQSAIQRLKKRIATFVVNQVPLQRALQLHADTTGVPIEIRTEDLEAAGISRNQRITLRLAGKTADEVLRAALVAANPDGELVYVITRQGGRKRIAVTTRTAAYERGESLPRALWQPIEQRLKRPITLQIKRPRPASEVFEQLAAKAGIDLLIRFDDLPEEDIGNPRALTADATGRPAGELLPELLKKAYGEEADVAYVFANVDGEEYLVLTSRKAAQQRGEKLP